MILADTNLLVGYATPTDPRYQVADAALAALVTAGHTPVLVPQNLYEFWAVATRPKGQNGLELTTAEAAVAVRRLRGLFPLLPDPPALVDAWGAMVLAHDCKGKPSHDARLVAAMSLHGITEILTFNGADFARYPGLTVLDTAAVAASLPTGP